MSLSRVKKKKAIFLDRDGTLTVRPHLTWKRSQLRLQRGAAAALRTLRRLGFIVVVVSNQSVIGRGYISETGVNRLHELLAKRLIRGRARVDAFYFCPHHPAAAVEKYRKNCSCRKPKAGLLLLAASDLNIDLKKSFMVGDMTWDIAAGKRAGAKTILVETGHAGRDKRLKIKPDLVAADILEASRLIRKKVLSA